MSERTARKGIHDVMIDRFECCESILSTYNKRKKECTNTTRIDTYNKRLKPFRMTIKTGEKRGEEGNSA